MAHAHKEPVITNQLDNVNSLGYNPGRMSATCRKKSRAKKWILYLLACSDNTLYTGITNDLDRRLKQHNDGTASRYTRSRLPIRLLYQEPCHGRSQSLRKEHAMKQLSRKKKEEYIRSHG
jgi:predicted GIY-YIG superfamily endonuclease